MSRKEYIDSLPEETRKNLAEMKQHNAEAMKANAVIKVLNADLKTAMADIHDADGAKATAAQQLGASASKTDLAAKETEIKSAKYTDVVTLMTKDTELRPTESVLWAYLGQGQLGLKKYDDAETAFKKAIDLDTASKKPRPEIEGLANSGLGEIYARNGKVPEAAAAYDAAVKADPTKAGFYYKNEAVIYSQVGNGDAQAAAADKAIAANPNDAVPYYLKGQALIGKATMSSPIPRRRRSTSLCLQAAAKPMRSICSLIPTAHTLLTSRASSIQPVRRSTPATRPPRSSSQLINASSRGASIQGAPFSFPCRPHARATAVYLLNRFHFLQHILEVTMGHTFKFAAATLVCLACSLTAHSQARAAQDAATIAHRNAIEKELESVAIIERKVMVPMHDGKRMQADLYRPRDESKKYPIIFVRTPYDFNYWDIALGAPRDMTTALDAVKHGYAYVEMNERGRYFSEGDYDILGVPLTDSDDEFDWMTALPWSTGKVGLIGCSSTAEWQLNVASRGNKALATIIPESYGAGVGRVGPYYEQGNWFRGGAVQMLFATWLYDAGLQTNEAKPNFPSNTSQQALVEAAKWWDLNAHPPQVDWSKALAHLPEKDILAAVGAPQGIYADNTPSGQPRHDRADT